MIFTVYATGSKIPQMASTAPTESFAGLVEQFPGIERLEPTALGRFAFHAAVHKPTESFQYHQTNEEYQDWHREVRDVLNEVESWRYGETQVSRWEMAKSIIEREQRKQEVNTLKASLETLDADEGYATVLEYLLTNSCKIATDMAPGPLFPEGRTAITALENATDPDTGWLQIPYHGKLVDGSGNELDKDLTEFINSVYPRLKYREKVAHVVESIGKIEPQEIQELRTVYGTKAANLICFNKKLNEMKQMFGDLTYFFVTEIPSFTAVPVDMYRLWKSDPSAFAAQCEQTRLLASELIKSTEYRSASDMVIIRSSAVKSEDGDEHSGAGIYKSVAVDPHDPEAFRMAVEEVYASTNSDNALAYQRSIGVEEELMGLIVQIYKEEASAGWAKETFWGHANSRGSNPNILELHTQEGMLLYDRVAVERNLFVEDRSDSGSLLHLKPDHNKQVRAATYKAIVIPHATVLAEELFGRPMQVEFINNAVVQVRPFEASGADVVIGFPEDTSPIIECSGFGRGDMELKMLEPGSDNTEKQGFVVFWGEYGFTMRDSDYSYNTFPKTGAVVLVRPSSSGHIQALCQEKGLLCFYPKNGEDVEGVEDLMYDDRGAPLTDVVLRFVSDGYEGRIYPVLNGQSSTG